MANYISRQSSQINCEPSLLTRYFCTNCTMSGEDETTCVELTALEQNNGSQLINQGSYATASNNTHGAEKESKNWQYLEVALLSAAVVVVVLLLVLPTIFYHLPLPVRLIFFMYMWCSIVSSTVTDAVKRGGFRAVRFRGRAGYAINNVLSAH